MKKIRFYKKTLAVPALLLFLTGCAGDDASQENSSVQPGTENMTRFSVAEDAVGPQPASATRTAGEYTGSAVKFYWTSGDRLWVNDAATALKVSNRSTISATAGKETAASFYFDGVFTAPSYPVRYTGNGNTAGDKVTIKAEQLQQAPNDGAHIGTDGDCGTAVAGRQGDGSYRFMLDHKASYLTFAPYDSKGELAGTVSVQQIKVTADRDIAGTYGFDDSGIRKDAASATSRCITLTLSDRFTLSQTSDYTRNGAIMVLAPGDYANVTVAYTLKDSKTGVTGTVSKTYSTLKLNAGRNRLVKFDLALPRYEMKYYMWDAGKDYWNTYTGTLPAVDGEQAPFNGKNTDRYFNGNGSDLYAVNSCKTCPNANEATLYAFRGDPHWDETTLWVMNKHLYIGGMWFKKLQYCDAGPYHSPVKVYPDGKDYRDNSVWKDWVENSSDYHGKWVKTPAQGKPSDTSRYFYLPAMGYLDNGTSNGKLRLGASGYSGAYWTSTSVKKWNGSLQAVSLHFSKSEVGLDVDDRVWAYPLFAVQ